MNCRTAMFCLVVVAFIASHAAQAQMNDTKSLDSACACLKRLDSKMNLEEYNARAQECMVSALMQNPDFMDAVTKAGDRASEIGEKMGEEFGIELVKRCPESAIALMRLGESSKTNSAEAAEGSSTGTLERIETKGYVTIVLKVSGREMSFLWLRPFDGSDDLKKGIGKMKGKKVTLRWREIECYNPTLKDYVKMKEITALQEAR